jgi:hypothetical protein
MHIRAYLIDENEIIACLGIYKKQSAISMLAQLSPSKIHAQLFGIFDKKPPTSIAVTLMTF